MNTSLAKSEFTNDYGKFYLISFLSSIYCRMTYLSPRDYLITYTEIFGKIIPENLMKDMSNSIDKYGLSVLIDDTKMFGLTSNDQQKYEMDIIKVNDKLSLKFLPRSKFQFK